MGVEIKGAIGWRCTHVAVLRGRRRTSRARKGEKCFPEPTQGSLAMGPKTFSGVTYAKATTVGVLLHVVLSGCQLPVSKLSAPFRNWHYYNGSFDGFVVPPLAGGRFLKRTLCTPCVCTSHVLRHTQIFARALLEEHEGTAVPQGSKASRSLTRQSCTRRQLKTNSPVATA